MCDTARAVAGDTNPVVTCGPTRSACVSSLHATVATATAASDPPTSTASPSGTGATTGATSRARDSPFAGCFLPLPPPSAPPTVAALGLRRRVRPCVVAHPAHGLAEAAQHRAVAVRVPGRTAVNLEHLRDVLHQLRDADAERGERLGVTRVG